MNTWNSIWFMSFMTLLTLVGWGLEFIMIFVWLPRYTGIPYMKSVFLRVVPLRHSYLMLTVSISGS